MKKQLFVVFLIVLGYSCSANKEQSNLDYVDPFIGTADNGHTFPGACAPFGMIQVSPDTGNGIWKYCSGYNIEDDSIIGFSQTHLNGTGVPDLGDILMLPFAGEIDTKKPISKYSRESQKAKPGYYGVHLTDSDIDVELTASERTAFHKYTFNKGESARVYINLLNGLWDKPDDSKEPRFILKGDVNISPDNKQISGHNTVKAWVERQVFYVIKFDKPFKIVEELVGDGEKLTRKYILEFDLGSDAILQTKIALSTTSINAAQTSLDKENSNWDFESIKKETQSKWKELLSRVTIKGTEDQKNNFYTSMYHLFIQPNNIADTDGKYRGANDSIYIAQNGEYYSTLSLWDTYRAAHPLYTILTPERVDGMVQSMVDHYRVQGYLPIWTVWGKENHCMIGNHAVPVIADAYLKGFEDFDVNGAYEAVKSSLTKSHFNSDWATYDKSGYYPYDIVTVESVSRTLESGFDDYSAAQMAKVLGKDEDYKFFTKRANYYKNLFDSETKLMRPKDAKGNWQTPFDRFLLSHAHTSGGDYTEGNAWQYTWHVQHDIEGLIELMGSKEYFATKLDSLFVLDKIEHGDGFVDDVTGLIGQYAHGNEPSHHVAYLYNYVGRSDRTQELIREIFDRFYLPKPDGLCGNDDCGQMSAWYIFSAMGFYPVNPVGGEYILGAPQIEYVSLNLPEGKVFTMEANALTEENKYVEKVELNGKEITDYKIHHSDIMQGGKLVFWMTNKIQHE